MSRIQKHTMDWFKSMVSKTIMCRLNERKHEVTVTDEEHAYALHRFQNELGYRYYEVKKEAV